MVCANSLMSLQSHCGLYEIVTKISAILSRAQVLIDRRKSIPIWEKNRSHPKHLRTRSPCNAHLLLARLNIALTIELYKSAVWIEWIFAINFSFQFSKMTERLLSTEEIHDLAFRTAGQHRNRSWMTPRYGKMTISNIVPSLWRTRPTQQKYKVWASFSSHSRISTITGRLKG